MMTIQKRILKTCGVTLIVGKFGQIKDFAN